MLIDDLKARIVVAMKAQNRHERDTLKVALGEMQLAETRNAVALTEDEAQAVLKKVIKGNREMISLATDAQVIERMKIEITLLSSFLPQSLTQDEIVSALAPVVDALRSAGNDGQATGVAMKHLKSNGHTVEGQTVSAAVKQLRAS
ncbi:MAG: GatB/YqeY domain-containing protein [Algisphaera sp.]